jgi:hypothetical protein
VCAPATVTCTDWAGGELVRALLDGLAEGVEPPGAAVLLPLLLADGELPPPEPLLVPLPLLLSLLLPPPLSRFTKAYVSPPTASASAITPAITAAAARRLRTGSVEVGESLGGG